MKRRKLFAVSLVVAVLVLGGTLTSVAFNPFGIISEKYEQQDMNETMSELRTMNYEEICDEFNLIVSSSATDSDIIAHTAVLFEKIDTVTDEKILQEIQNKNNSEQLRVSLIQALSHKNNGQGINNLAPVRSLLLDENENSTVRQNAVYALIDDPISKNTVIAAVSSNDEDVAFQALKGLNIVDPELARSLADDIIEVGEDGARLRSAIKVKSYEYQAEPYSTEIPEFISFCKDVYSSSSDEMTRATIVFALSDLYNEEALRFIINEDTIENSLKTFCIDQNYLVLKEMLLNNPSTDDIQFVISCCNIYPIDQVLQTLENTQSTLVIPTYPEVYPANTDWDYYYNLGRS